MTTLWKWVIWMLYRILALIFEKWNIKNMVIIHIWKYCVTLNLSCLSILNVFPFPISDIASSEIVLNRNCVPPSAIPNQVVKYRKTNVNRIRKKTFLGDKKWVCAFKTSNLCFFVNVRNILTFQTFRKNPHKT